MVDSRQMAQPVVMVARLDGPSPAIVRRMIDDAIATEETGLGGHGLHRCAGPQGGPQRLR